MLLSMIFHNIPDLRGHTCCVTAHLDMVPILPSTGNYFKSQKDMMRNDAKKIQPYVGDILVKFLVDERGKNKHRVLNPLLFLNEYKQLV